MKIDFRSMRSFGKIRINYFILSIILLSLGIIGLPSKGSGIKPTEIGKQYFKEVQVAQANNEDPARIQRPDEQLMWDKSIKPYIPSIILFILSGLCILRSLLSRDAKAGVCR